MTYDVPKVLLESVKPRYENGKKPARTVGKLIIKPQEDGFDEDKAIKSNTTEQIVELIVESAGIPAIDVTPYTGKPNQEQARAIAASDHKILHLNCLDCSEDIMRILAQSKAAIFTDMYYELIQKYPG